MIISNKIKYLLDATIVSSSWALPDYIPDFFKNITFNEAADALIKAMQIVTTFLILVIAFYRFLKSRKEHNKENKKQ